MEQTEDRINAICICSDSSVGRSKNNENNFGIEDLPLPASTNAENIIKQFEGINNSKQKNNRMTVVFSTYQSIDIISKAQAKLNSKYGNNEYDFDLIICDEAHRTTGIVLKDKGETDFVKVHNNNFIRAKKRLYMTATPRLYSDNVKEKAAQDSNIDVLCSMDDENIYGKEIYRLGFGKAVDEGLLSDYKVLVLTVNQDIVSNKLLKEICAKNEEESDGIETDDIAKLIGCVNALSKHLLHEENLIKNDDPQLMKRAVAFCQSIAVSKQITNIFNGFKESYYKNLDKETRDKLVVVEAEHIDGTMSAIERDKKLSWLKSERGDNTCNVLTNVKCLSEGVDVPSLDAVMFLASKNSQVEVVQSVGRVMRKADGKKFGYIIIPVVIPYGEKPEKYLDKSEKFKVVWQVLNALRSHDDRFDAYVNSINLNGIENIAKKDQKVIFDNISQEEVDINTEKVESELKKQLELDFGEYQEKIVAKMVQKVGDRKYFENWAKDVADIAKANINRIKDIIATNTKAKNEFNKFISKLHKEINSSISEEGAIEMLGQHLVTQPIFDVLFENYKFTENNPVSKSIAKLVSLLEEQTSQEESKKLNEFCEYISIKIKGATTPKAKQELIKNLYGDFFALAFKKLSDKLGIVYTPVEVVDFIIHSVADILKKEFNKDISDKGVEIIDPFTGTGTFITRLLQSGVIRQEDLERKYKKEIFANEIVLLAYYIASVNIENVYHDLHQGDSGYKTFEGICLTDTFQLYEDMEQENIINNTDNLMKDVENTELSIIENSERINKQKKAKITIVIGNPPYSASQKSANDDNQNQHYPKLDKKIADTYVKNSTAQKTKSYDSYIRAFRWASDRIDKKNGGIIGFVTNSGWIDSNSADGFRHCLENEFSDIYVFDLRGSIRGKSGELQKREGGNIFEKQIGVAITILVKKPDNAKAKIHYYDIGDYLKAEEKLNILNEVKSIASDKIKWQDIKPNEHNDWLNKRCELFETLIPIEPKKKYDLNAKSFFVNYSLGINTARDVWTYNFLKEKLETNINTTINYYNQQRIEVNENHKELIKDKTKGNWTDLWDNYLKKNLELKEDKDSYFIGTYRPFCKQNVYFNEYLIHRRYQMPSIFPNHKLGNLCICVSGLSSGKDFSCLIVNDIPGLDFLSKTQCFPLYYYKKIETQQMNLFDQAESEYIRKDGISDYIFNRAKESYEKYGLMVTKEDIFYYVYGILHSPSYREKFQADLKKVLPRLPLVDEPRDFHIFSNAGKQLAELHLNYENIPANPNVKVIGREKNNFIVKKMQFAKNGKEKDKTTIIYNNAITITNIPEKAYKYIINGKSAIEWIMDRYQIKTDEDSNITNDPNDWACENNKLSYILDLLLSIIELSIRTVDIIDNLPEIKEIES